jgi:hypothetical protein
VAAASVCQDHRLLYVQSRANLGHMKNPTLLTALLTATLVSACSQPGTSSSAMEPQYVNEAALPKDWPAPGPYNQATRKEYPSYRAAFTTSSSPNGGFWTLFKHIKRNNIPMTSPVEMTLKNEPGNALQMEQMGFLYQSKAVGKTGSDGETVTVRDIPALSVMSYTWQGPRDEASVAKAQKAIETQLRKNKLTSTSFRLFGYNSPSVPRKKQTFELQALLK